MMKTSDSKSKLKFKTNKLMEFSFKQFSKSKLQVWVQPLLQSKSSYSSNTNITYVNKLKT